MARPVVSTFTERLYGGLPEFYREADLELDYPLLRFLSLLGDQAGEAEELFDRIDYVTVLEGGDAGDTSDLVDPAVADAGWLPWLAQLVGARLSPLIAVPEQRVTISTAAAGFQAGSRDALAEVARRALTGEQYVNITPNLDGDPWVIGLATAEEDTPSIAAVIAAVEDAGAKPAGYRLEVTFYTASWDTLEAAYPTSDDWDAVGGVSSDALERTRPPA